MSGWQVGDLAVCVAAGDASGECPLTLGRTYTVAHVICATAFSQKYGLGDTGLLLVEASPPTWAYNGFDARRFRKVRPDTHEACEAEFVTLLKRSPSKVSA